VVPLMSICNAGYSQILPWSSARLTKRTGKTLSEASAQRGSRLGRAINFCYLRSMRDDAQVGSEQHLPTRSPRMFFTGEADHCLELIPGYVVATDSTTLSKPVIRI
jgi:hypothetical protein